MSYKIRPQRIEQLAIISALLVILSGLITELGIQHSAIAYVATSDEPRAALIEVQPAVLDDIADCESGIRLPNGKAVKGSGTHFNADGTVKIGEFTDPRFGEDVGEYQISTYYHGERARSLGLDIYDEQDNARYARLLYRENGTRDWSASRECWK